MSERPSPKPTNVKPVKGRKRIPPADEPVKFKADVLLYFVIAWLISAPIFVPLAMIIMNDYFLKWYEEFFSIIGISVISDLVSGYLASFPVAKAASKYYNASYFVAWYSQRTQNILRNFLNWIFSAGLYVGGIIYFASMSIFGTVTVWTYIIIYFFVKIISFGLAYLIAEQLTRIPPKAAR
jgi:hypothetical protein